MKNKLMQKLRKTYRYEDISKTTNFKTSQEAIIKRAIDFIKKTIIKK